MDMLKDLVQKKMKEGAPEMDPKYKDAKMSVLQQISDMAGKAMGDDINDLHQNKVSVAAPDREGLQKGLEKAQELVGQDGLPLDSNEMDDEDGEMEPDEEEGSSYSEHSPHEGKAEHMLEDQIDEESDEDDLSDEDYDALIKDLQDKKARKAQK